MRERDAAKPAQPMLFDEAVAWLLLNRLDNAPRATFSIGVEDGQFQARYESEPWEWEGDWLPNLTDALCSLIARMP